MIRASGDTALANNPPRERRAGGDGATDYDSGHQQLAGRRQVVRPGEKPHTSGSAGKSDGDRRSDQRRRHKRRAQQQQVAATGKPVTGGGAKGGDTGLVFGSNRWQ
ncbi:hypothetical protein EVAR_38072_1 [Eumeta japonica]|uniref:Uncharacterized protein n=1 Tax=Eumeta variegata TaxID=151549 RepID=A0A4C1WAY2_EUMVA|nr:hypothetical protein EVAR_38072_1 [Eumeta japonica]